MEGDRTPRGTLLQGRYRLAEVIGDGGAAWVYRARDEALDREVAVKVFRATSDGPAVGRQVDEVKVLARLNHHGLVTILDAGVASTQDGERHIFFVMELVQGTDLRRRLDEGPIPARQVAYLGLNIAEALEYIHGRDVIHRDIKPANVLLVEYSPDQVRPHTKLADFGVAKITDPSSATLDGQTLGTAAYLSPEQARGLPITPACDIYSLGLVLLQCFTGELAFPGDIAQSAVARLLHDPAVPDWLPPEWHSLLTRMTAREPGDRPSIHEVALELRAIVVLEYQRPGRRSAVLPAESARAAAVRRYDVAGADGDPGLERIARLAQRVCDVPVALITIVDGDRDVFVARVGIDLPAIERRQSICTTTITLPTPYVLGDIEGLGAMPEDDSVLRALELQSYAGAQLRTGDGHAVGALCVLDRRPRSFTSEQVGILEELAALAMERLDLLRVASLAIGAQQAASVPVPWVADALAGATAHPSEEDRA